LSARIAPGAQFEVDLVLLVRGHRNGIDRTALSANRAARTVVEDTVFDEGSAFPSRTSALQVGFVFGAKIAEGGKHRVGSRFAQAAQTAGANLARKVFELSQILPLAFASHQPVKNIEHSPGADAAECAFAAGLVLSKL